LCHKESLGLKTCLFGVYLSFQGPKTDVFMQLQAHEITSLQIHLSARRNPFIKSSRDSLSVVLSYLVCEY